MIHRQALCRKNSGHEDIPQCVREARRGEVRRGRTLTLKLVIVKLNGDKVVAL